MADYPLTWVSDSIAVGYAPMSYAELDSIKAGGIIREPSLEFKNRVDLTGFFSIMSL